MSDLLTLLDNGWHIHLFRNGLGSYTAEAAKELDFLPSLTEDGETLKEEIIQQQHLTDGWTPEKALDALVEKVVFGRVG